jgi:hypothetical protein
VALQSDSKVLVSGLFTNLSGTPRTNLARLNNNDLPVSDLQFDGNTVTWMRGGTLPEAWRVQFSVSTNGTDWDKVGDGVRIAGGWQFMPDAYPSNATIRARAYIVVESSSWYIETFRGKPYVASSPSDRTNSFFSAGHQFDAVINPLVKKWSTNQRWRDGLWLTNPNVDHQQCAGW